MCPLGAESRDVSWCMPKRNAVSRRIVLYAQPVRSGVSRRTLTHSISTGWLKGADGDFLSRVPSANSAELQKRQMTKLQYFELSKRIEGLRDFRRSPTDVSPFVDTAIPTK